MTDQDIQQTKDNALLRCIRLKRNADIANEALNQTAAMLEEVAQILRSPRRTDFVFDNRPWLNPAPLYRLIQEADKFQRDFAEANSIAARLGEAI